jgi:hypothetical protein
MSRRETSSDSSTLSSKPSDSSAADFPSSTHPHTALSCIIIDLDAAQCQVLTMRPNHFHPNRQPASGTLAFYPHLSSRARARASYGLW